MKYDNSDIYAGFKTGYKYKIGSKEYINEVLNNFGLLHYKELFSSFEKETLSSYEDKTIREQYMLYKKIQSGRFMLEHNRTYKNNYVQMLKNNGFPQKYIDIVKNTSLRKFIGNSNLLPSINYFYAKGKYAREHDYDERKQEVMKTLDKFATLLNKGE